jgi:RNA polymerase sigma-70 factor (ECF subfamily)
MELKYIKQVLDGDISKFSYIIETYKHMAYSIAYRILNNREDAEEVVQDSFFKAFKALSSFKGESKFSTWLYKIVVNHSLSKLKGRRPSNKYINIDDVPDIIAESTESVYKNLVKDEKRKFITLALTELEIEDRLVLTLYYLEENSIGEVAEITSISSDNIKMKIHRARKKMLFVLNKILKNESKF